MGWALFGKYSYVTGGKLPLPLKSLVYNQCVLPLMTYGAKTGSLAEVPLKKA